MTVNEIAMVAMIILYGVIFWLTHDDDDAYYPEDEVEGIPVEELE